MKPFAFYLLISIFVISGCRPAAKPVGTSNKPVVVNDVRQTNVPLPPSKPLSEMTWTGFDGQEQRLKDLQGKVVILDFWATNCPPCIEEIPHLNELRAKYGDDNLKIVGMHVGDDEDRKLVPEFVERLKISYPLAYPEDALSRFIFSTQSDIPQTAIFDRKGIMIKKIVGFSSGIKKDLDSTVEMAVNSK
jgi:thiol-disulfide isomerase/thioredoxin